MEKKFEGWLYLDIKGGGMRLRSRPVPRRAYEMEVGVKLTVVLPPLSTNLIEGRIQIPESILKAFMLEEGEQLQVEKRKEA